MTIASNFYPPPKKKHKSMPSILPSAFQRAGCINGLFLNQGKAKTDVFVAVDRISEIAASDLASPCVGIPATTTTHTGRASLSGIVFAPFPHISAHIKYSQFIGFSRHDIMCFTVGIFNVPSIILQFVHPSTSAKMAPTTLFATFSRILSLRLSG